MPDVFCIAISIDSDNIEYNSHENRLYCGDCKVVLQDELVLTHPVINHSQGYVRHRTIHTNIIEGFWSMVKRAWFGSHHHYSRENAHLYVGETAYKANNRENGNLLMDTIKRMLS